MMRFIRLIPALVLFCYGLSLHGQFILNGDAVQSNDSCYQLTPAVNWSSGSIWNPQKVSLNNSFEVVMDIYLGCQDGGGADGIVFGFQPISTSIGAAGGGIGFQGIVPSIGIEFDTWQNLNLSDPAFDHLALIRNGNLNHSGADNLAGAVQASATSPNVEDCRFHSLRVSWNAASSQLSVYFDCTQRLVYQADIVNGIFNGDPEVFWGFTSATGAANNLHQVCFSYTTFQDQIPDVVLCPGGQVQLRARGGSSYNWTPAEGLSNPSIPNPIATPSQTTTYTVEVRDDCGIPFFDEVVVEVAGDSVFFELGPDTSICQGASIQLDASSSSASYQWSNGQTTPSISASEPGTYAVTVTKTDTFCIADDFITLEVIPLPFLELSPVDTILCEGTQLLLRPSAWAGALQWDNGSTADSLLASSSGTYRLSASNECGSESRQSSLTIESCRETYIPNAFSPNDDGRNDHFYIQDGGDIEDILLFRVFDRWGNLLFEAANIAPNDPQLGWDGTFRGKTLNPGVYTYFAEITFRDGFTEVRSGEVNLLR